MILFPLVKRKKSQSSSLLDPTGLTRIGGATSGGGLDAAFDGTTSQATVDSARGSGTGNWVGLDFGASNSKVITAFTIYAPNNATLTANTSSTITVTLYGSNSSPASATDGTSLHSASSVSTPGASGTYTVSAGISGTAYRYIWAYVVATECAYAELELTGY